MKRSTAQIASFLVAATLAMVVASCTTDNPATPANSAISDMEKNVHNQINGHRTSIGLGTLTLDESISAQARQHSQDMADGKVPFGHDGFSDRVSAIQKSITIDSAGENVAFNSGFADPATNAVTGWLNSPPHKANIEGGFDVTGIGIVQNSSGVYYFTQIFVKRR
jgi:uncharacterized protein YkwD